MALIEVRGLRKTYGRTVAVDSLDLDVAEGQVVGVLGPNGAGTTTTVECVAGLTRPDAGTVTVAGHVPWRDRGAVTRLLGVQLQSSGLPAELTAREAVQLVAACHDDPVDPDELTTGLDPEARRQTWDLVRDVRDAGTTVVPVTHLMEEAQQLCDRVTVVAGGRVAPTSWSPRCGPRRQVSRCSRPRWPPRWCPGCAGRPVAG
ncbi:ABC transporter ATP-binding protein [Klenkia brasiliensis]|uniref:ABC transporter ATP-binding protein n=1 Tax=Klenkia brasiliensis TaxID=333142 RepID=UPI000A69C400|nr:ATP-binding cassette domain-containing protein [Klenkia brasiliensis]